LRDLRQAVIREAQKVLFKVYQVSSFRIWWNQLIRQHWIPLLCSYSLAFVISVTFTRCLV
jgi:hypothetical protein